MWNRLDRAVIGLLDQLLETRMSAQVFLMLLWLIGIVVAIALAGKVVGA